jgi:hypothetical protein
MMIVAASGSADRNRAADNRNATESREHFFIGATLSCQHHWNGDRSREDGTYCASDKHKAP